MAYAVNQYTGNGSNKNFAVTFPFISRDHVKVYVSGVPKTFGWVNDGLIVLTQAPANGAHVFVVRESSRGTPLVDFQDAQVLTERALDLAARQSLYIAQEAFDASELAEAGQNVLDAATSAGEAAAEAAAQAATAATSADSASHYAANAAQSAVNASNVIANATDEAQDAAVAAAASAAAAAASADAAEGFVLGLGNPLSADGDTMQGTLTLHTASGKGDIVGLTIGNITDALGYTPVQTVTATSPVVAGGTAKDPVISMPAATALVPGHMTADQAAKLEGLDTSAKVNRGGDTMTGVLALPAVELPAAGLVLSNLYYSSGWKYRGAGGGGVVLMPEFIDADVGAACFVWKGTGINEGGPGAAAVPLELAKLNVDNGRWHVKSQVADFGFGFKQVLDIGASGASKSVSFDGFSQYQRLTMTASCTITLTPPPYPCVCHLEIEQNGTGGWVATFATSTGTIKWDSRATASDKLLSTAASAIDLLIARWNGSYWFFTLQKGLA
jgi:hypothetical protein